MNECLLAKTTSMFGDLGNAPRISAGYKIKTEEPLADRERGTGQIILSCSVDGCNAELEVYPHPHTKNLYEVEQPSIRAARFVCHEVRKDA